MQDMQFRLPVWSGVPYQWDGLVDDNTTRIVAQVAGVVSDSGSASIGIVSHPNYVSEVRRAASLRIGGQGYGMYGELWVVRLRAYPKN